jgi:hypothetical protein
MPKPSWPRTHSRVLPATLPTGFNVMKTMKRKIYLVPLFSMLAVAAGCDDTITDFGFTGNISGMVTDQSGNIISGNSATNDLRVFVLGEDETQPLEIRVRGDGSYANTHLFPQLYKLWITGPVVTQATPQNPISVDLRGGPVTHDLTATPFLTIDRPTATSPAGNAISISYRITPTAATGVQTGGNRVAYISTATWPGPTTGNVLNRTHTITRQLPNNAGTVTVDGLRPGRTYYVRVAARAVGTNLWNYSEQVSVVNP